MLCIFPVLKTLTCGRHSRCLGWTYKLLGGQKFSFKFSPLSVGCPRRRPLNLIERLWLINYPRVRFCKPPCVQLMNNAFFAVHPFCALSKLGCFRRARSKYTLFENASLCCLVWKIGSPSKAWKHYKNRGLARWQNCGCFLSAFGRGTPKTPKTGQLISGAQNNALLKRQRIQFSPSPWALFKKLNFGGRGSKTAIFEENKTRKADRRWISVGGVLAI